MHLYDLPSPLREALGTTAMADLRIMARITGYARSVVGYTTNGTPLFTSSPTQVQWWDVNRISQGSLSIGLSKPALPSNGDPENNPTATEMRVTFNNTDEYMSVTALPSMFDRSRFEQTEVMIVAQIGDDVGTQFPIYKGRVIGRPEESFGQTTVTIRDEMWVAIRRPVLFEKFGLGQQSQVLGGVMNHGYFDFAGVRAYDGVVIFGEDGTLLTSVSTSKPDDVDIARIEIGNGALPGKYVIEFESGLLFKVIYPNNDVLYGNPIQDFSSPTISINAADWVITGNPKDAKIEFFVSAVYYGNPISIIANLLEKAFTEAYGTTPIQPATVPIDWPTFNTLEGFFTSFKVYVDITNPSNDVWEKRVGKRPLSTLQLCQLIADHIGCSIIANPFGFITIKAPGVLPEVHHPMRDGGNVPAIVAYKVDAQTTFNFFEFGYGYNSLTGSYSTTILFDERVDPADEVEEYRINWRFYKQGRSTNEANYMAKNFLRRIFTGYSRMTLNIKPNWGMMLLPGDRFRAITETAPRVSMAVEVVSIEKAIGGECVAKVMRIGDAIDEVATYCVSTYCNSNFA